MNELTQQDISAIYEMPDDRHKKEKRRDKTTKHIRSTLAEILSVLEQLFAFAFKFFGDVNGVVWVKGSIDPRDINRRH